VEVKIEKRDLPGNIEGIPDKRKDGQGEDKKRKAQSDYPIPQVALGSLPIIRSREEVGGDEEEQTHEKRNDDCEKKANHDEIFEGNHRRLRYGPVSTGAVGLARMEQDDEGS
jgi:hypothetical protein